MSSEYDEGPVAQSGQAVRRALDGKFVCPFCGSVNGNTDEPCPKCGMENTPATRNSTRARIGPWYVLQKRNPSAPGMKFDTLLRFVQKGRVNARTIVRGPTTSQLWRFAATVKGLSREFGLCYNCGGDCDQAAALCPHCGRNQQPPADPDQLLETKAGAAGSSPRGDSDTFADQVIGDDGDLHVESHPDDGPRPAAKKPASPTPPSGFAFNTAAPSAPRTAAPSPSGKGKNTPIPENPVTAQMRREAQERREIEAGRRQREAERRDPNKHVPTLNAAELATAFQLDFKPSALGRPRHRKSHGKLYVFLTLLLLIGGGVWAYLKVPAVKNTVDTTYANVSEQVKTLAAKWNQPADAKVNQGVDALTTQIPATNKTTAAKPQPPRTAPAARPPIAVKQPKPELKPEPKVDATPEPKAEPKVVAPPVVVTPAAAPVTPKPAPKLTEEQAVEQARKLWRHAFDCEASGDWAGAVESYEQIKALTPKVWPGGLDMRLNNAKNNLRR